MWPVRKHRPTKAVCLPILWGWWSLKVKIHSAKRTNAQIPVERTLGVRRVGSSPSTLWGSSGEPFTNMTLSQASMRIANWKDYLLGRISKPGDWGTASDSWGQSRNRGVPCNLITENMQQLNSRQRLWGWLSGSLPTLSLSYCMLSAVCGKSSARQMQATQGEQASLTVAEKIH